MWSSNCSVSISQIKYKSNNCIKIMPETSNEVLAGVQKQREDRDAPGLDQELYVDPTRNLAVTIGKDLM